MARGVGAVDSKNAPGIRWFDIAMKVLPLFVSHAILWLAGLGIGSYFRSETPAIPSGTKYHLDRDSRVPLDGAEIISLIETKLRREAENSVEPVPVEQLLRRRLLASLPGAVLPDDPRTVIQRKVRSAENESDWVEAATQLTLWLRSDPEGALTFATSNEAFPNSDLRRVAVELACEEILPETLLPLMSEGTSGNDPVFSGIARQVIASRSPEEIALLIRECAAKTRSNLQFHIASNWPADRLLEFGRLATLLDEPKLFDHLPDEMTDGQKVEWLMRYVDQHPDPGFVRRVRSETTYFVLLRNDFSLPLEERLRGIVFRPVYESLSPAAAREKAMKFLAGQDVSQFLFSRDEPDLLYAFRHGRIEVEELLEVLESKFPEYAEAGLLSGNLHKMICGSDPVRADALLAGMSPEDHAEAIADAISSSAYRMRLDTLQFPSQTPCRGKVPMQQSDLG